MSYPAAVFRQKGLKMTEKNDDIIEMTDEEGKTYKAEIVELIEFEDKEYAVLSELDDKKHCDCEDDECNSNDYVLMRVIKDGEDFAFETIDDDEEFERVSAYIDELAEETEN